MLVHEILNTEIAPIKTTDTVNLALIKLDLLKTTRFPVVEDDQLLGMVSLEALIDAEDESVLIKEIPLVESVFVPSEQHIFEAARSMLAHELYLIPVVNGEREFVGMIRKHDVLEALGDIFNLSSFGSVITVELMPYDFTLSELIRLIETEGAKILGIAVEQPKGDLEFFRVSIKLNIEDTVARYPRRDL